MEIGFDEVIAVVEPGRTKKSKWFQTSEGGPETGGSKDQ